MEGGCRNDENVERSRDGSDDETLNDEITTTSCQHEAIEYLE